MCSLFSVSLQLRKRLIATEINSIPNSRLDKGKCRTANFRLTCVEVLVDMLGACWQCIGHLRIVNGYIAAGLKRGEQFVDLHLGQSHLKQRVDRVL